MPVEGWLYFTVSFMIFASIVALELKDLLSSVVSVGVAGLALAVAFIFLQAPDLALVQFVYEIVSVIILILLLKATGERLEQTKENKLSMYFKVFFLVLILIMVVPLFSSLPEFGNPLLEVAGKYLKDGATETGSANMVTSVILDYRVYDTLGEATVIFVSILGAVTLLSKRKRNEGDPDE
ncbi:hydrogen gas-evolving membrane-bound hydrogenase subunit E [Kosmotoga pacifica]|uniref:Uncharacterized protein n=1 Tax=Kosmotoga pacifica TaxID=1330330 RepID=A0A0G2Z7P8_9BACT|nr:hydrogen gas-evolving membrane-bound hydrogenase subunit E [Kosmotoga pacifica]AKI97572.1 hypothetical protein IX53_06795 [Kosmotoga pacifica]